MITRWLGTQQLLVKTKHFQELVLNKSSVLHGKTLLCHVYSSQFMEWFNLGITKLKHASYVCSPNIF